MPARPNIPFELADPLLRDHDVRQRGQLGLLVLEQEGGEFWFTVSFDGVLHAVVEVIGAIALAEVVVGDAEAGDLDEAFGELEIDFH